MTLMIKRGTGNITSDYGMNDYYKYYSKNYDKYDRSVYSKVISEFNNKMVDLILNESYDYKLPVVGMTITIRKNKNKPKIINNKLHTTAPVDWVTTKKLWNVNELAKKNKVLIRYLNNHTNGYVFKIYLKKFGSLMKNRSYYKFKANRTFQRKLGKKIKNGNFDAYLLY